jgi:hypothetical protein
MIFVLIFMPILALFQNCSNVSFDSDKASVEETGNPGSPTSVSEKFNPKSTDSTGPVDMIWVIDNSGSMTEEAAHVRTNLSNFIGTIQGRSDLHFLLVSKKGNSGLMTEIPVAYQSEFVIQQDLEIGSKDGPDKLITLLKTFTTLTKPGFFRANSLKSIVFVTDDNATLSSTGTIAGLADLGAGWDSGKLMVNSFIGLGQSTSPCQAKTGTVYTDLANVTGGNVFNICDLSWTDNFANLADSTIKTLERSFTLQFTALTIESIEVDGVALSSSDYQVKGKVVVLKSSVVLAANSEIVIKYTK